MNIEQNVYFGVILDLATLEKYKELLNIDDIYIYAFENGLDLQIMGDMDNPIKYVLGKQIYWAENYILNIFKKDNKIYLKNQYANLESDDEIMDLDINEQNIKDKLLSLGIAEKPEYYIFCSWINKKEA